MSPSWPRPRPRRSSSAAPSSESTASAARTRRSPAAVGTRRRPWRRKRRVPRRSSASLSWWESAGWRAAEALRRLGDLVEPIPWDTTGVGWAAFDAVVVRSVWDYHLRPAEFLRWVEAVDRAGTPLLNPAVVLRWNHHKSYLRDLA